MGLFDDLASAAEGALGGGGTQQALSGALESCAPGGLSGVLDKLQQGGLGDTIATWLPGGDHTPISPDEIRSALGEAHISALASSCGISPDELLAHLSEHLPALAAQQQASG